MMYGGVRSHYRVFFLVPLHLKLNHFRADRLEVTKHFLCAVPESGACPSGFRHSSNSFDCILGRTWGKICKERIESLIIIELSIIKRVIQKQKNSIIGRSLKAIERHQICFTTLYKHMQIETSKIDNNNRPMRWEWSSISWHTSPLRVCV